MIGLVTVSRVSIVQNYSIVIYFEYYPPGPHFRSDWKVLQFVFWTAILASFLPFLKMVPIGWSRLLLLPSYFFVLLQYSPLFVSHHIFWQILHGIFRSMAVKEYQRRRIIHTPESPKRLGAIKFQSASFPQLFWGIPYSAVYSPCAVQLLASQQMGILQVLSLPSRF